MIINSCVLMKKIQLEWNWNCAETIHRMIATLAKTQPNVICFDTEYNKWACVWLRADEPHIFLATLLNCLSLCSS